MKFTGMDRLDESVVSLLDYCKNNEWAGFDPYDALNSRLFAHTPFYKSRLCRIAITQIMKRLPINLRPLLLVPKTQNPKALALFLAAFLKLSKVGLPGMQDLAEVMTESIIALRAQDTPYWCWGYSFPWQTRTKLVPLGTPNLVCTTFVANALLDAYETLRETRYLVMAYSAAEYILNELYWTGDDSSAGFAYPLPTLKSQVHNANFLGSALFCRVYKLSGEQKFLDPALKVARYSASRHHEDGSWDYGELSTQRWIDNFHTGYNLCALHDIGLYAETSEFDAVLSRGFIYYKKHFFLDSGAPKYFNNRTYPIDIHSSAQSIITLLTLKSLDTDNIRQAFAVFDWTMDNLRDDQGYFYFQTLLHYRNKISYMRWSQAWMLLALSTLREHCDYATHEPSVV